MFETVLNVIRIAADIVIIVCAVKLMRKNRKWTKVRNHMKYEELVELLGCLQKLSREKQLEFYYMIKGAAVVAKELKD